MQLWLLDPRRQGQVWTGEQLNLDPNMATSVHDIVFQVCRLEAIAQSFYSMHGYEKKAGHYVCFLFFESCFVLFCLSQSAQEAWGLDSGSISTPFWVLVLLRGSPAPFLLGGFQDHTLSWCSGLKQGQPQARHLLNSLGVSERSPTSLPPSLLSFLPYCFLGWESLVDSGFFGWQSELQHLSLRFSKCETSACLWVWGNHKPIKPTLAQLYFLSPGPLSPVVLHWAVLWCGAGPWFGVWAGQTLKLILVSGTYEGIFLSSSEPLFCHPLSGLTFDFLFLFSYRGFWWHTQKHLICAGGIRIWSLGLMFAGA